MGAAVDSRTMIVAPSPVGKIEAMASEDDEMNYAVDSIQIVGEYAKSVGINISIEPWNRYRDLYFNQ